MVNSLHSKSLKMVHNILIDDNRNSISEREVEIVKLLSLGYNSKEIGEMLFISEHTVNTHRRNMVKRLDLKNSYQLIVWAFKKRVLSF
ncbi:response regulator transcription factor [Pedobacter fastidiosus]|uniref:Response regulator transcription factor n=1 Tax=Pedobacter fastidiosus TaxID=2765361 RepID=A0ABR7KLI0_9SPHI|nr:LuxR C-terminal-related transcriptional regulator [Pedobacter fastidiosus]MBC6108927.1 response regulator transcription factor [Pedobacter fastidiosus]